jgi:hypothetical protein
MRRSLRRATALAVVVALAGFSASAFAQRTAAPTPKSSMPLTIQYTGSFVMSNVLVPQSTPHSYSFRVVWTYWWTGTWATLFRDPSIYRSSPARFTKVAIAGSVNAAYKEKADDAVTKTCTMRVVRDNANRPAVVAAYDTSANTLAIMVEAPTFRGIMYAASSDPNCQGGPGVNVFGPGTSQSPPSSFNPLGAGATVKLSTGGSGRYDKTWTWKHTFAPAPSGPVPYRLYKATIRSGVSVAYKPCRLITACAKAKP